MERKKIMITGSQIELIRAVYEEIKGDFFSICSTGIEEDIKNHIAFFNPDMIIFCMNGERMENIPGILYCIKSCQVVLYGDKERLQQARGVFTPRLERSTEVAPAELAAGIREIFGLDIKQDSGIKKRVLAIDDDPTMLKLVKEYLNDRFQVATAINGRTALKYLESRNVDLILLDYEMPGENGPQVLRRLRENPLTEKIPVLFLTGITDKEKIQEALSLKPQGYLMKPIDSEKLAAAIKKFI